jgi:hypothetical protein
MEKILRIRDKQGRLAPLVLNRAQREYERCCRRRNIVLKARQLGITTYIAARFFLRTITRPGTLTVQVAHDQRAAEQIFRIVFRFLENLPGGFCGRVLRPSRANVRQIVFPALDSEYRVETAADPHAGRGLTIQNLHCSEVAMWPGGGESMAALRAAVPRNGEIVLESTPNGAAGVFYQEWQNAAETGYVRHFFPWWWEEKYRAPGGGFELSEEERGLVERFGLDREQIAFRREVQANFGPRAREEFAEDAQTCFRSSGECVFELELLEKQILEVPPGFESRINGQVQIWNPFLSGRKYVIGVDPAGGGTDGDLACAQVIDRETGLQCAELLGHLRPEELAREVAKLGREYGNAMVAVERNNHGHAVLACLTLQERYEPLYREGQRRDGEPGWLTTAASRPAMLENLAAVLRANPATLQSGRLLEQCRTFVRGREGRPEAASGSHDDAVMAMAIALAVRAEMA